MPVQILNDPGWASGVGQGLGMGLSEGLEALAHRKIQKLNQDKNVRGLEALGIPHDKAVAIAGLDPKVQGEIIKQALAAPQNAAYAQGLESFINEGRQAPQQQNVPNPLSSIFGMQGQQQAQPQQQIQNVQPAPGLQQRLAQPLSGNLRQMQEQLGSKIEGMGSSWPQALKEAQPGYNAQPEVVSQGLNALQNSNQPVQQQPIVQGQQQDTGFRLPAGVNQQQAQNLTNLAMQKQQRVSQENLAKERLATQKELAEMREEGKEKRHKESLSQTEQLVSDKETLPYYKATLSNAREAKNSEARLGRIEEITKKDLAQGSLTPRPLVLLNSWLKENRHIGIDFSALMSGDTQELEKLSNDFLRGASSALHTNKLTNYDLAQFLKTVPTLLQSNEGRLRVIENIRLFNEMTKLEKDAMNAIIKENHGRRPRDLQALVDERIDKDLDKIVERFKTASDDAVNSANQWAYNEQHKEFKKRGFSTRGLLSYMKPENLPSTTEFR